MATISKSNQQIFIFYQLIDIFAGSNLKQQYELNFCAYLKTTRNGLKQIFFSCNMLNLRSFLNVVFLYIF
jgi:hypothetical protein